MQFTFLHCGIGLTVLVAIWTWSFQFTALQCTELRCSALYCSRCTVVHCTAIQCSAHNLSVVSWRGAGAGCCLDGHNSCLVGAGFRPALISPPCRQGSTILQGYITPAGLAYNPAGLYNLYRASLQPCRTIQTPTGLAYNPAGLYNPLQGFKN